jgi:tetratricopeptide (TPR) repeat protein
LKRVGLKLLTSPVFRGAVGVAGAFLFLAASWWASLVGASRLLSDYGVGTGNLTAAETSIRMTPADPQAHVARADLLSVAGADDTPQQREAVRSYRDSLGLRPLDSALWNSLGQKLEEVGEADEALRAYTEATRLAPFYASPRWQLGNFLLRQGKDSEAFDHLRRAAQAEPTRFPNLVDLAWRFYGGDVQRVEAAVRPETDAERLRLARFYVKQKRAGEAMRQYLQLGGAVAEDDQKAMLADLLAAREFTEAHKIWSLSQPPEAAAEKAATGRIYDGGFEREIRLNEPGFGWQIGAANEPAVSVSLDGKEIGEGKRSLRIDFNGASAPAAPVVSQLVLVEAGRTYRLSFAARTKDLVTGGLPVVAVYDVSAPAEAVLAQSKTLPQGSDGWQTFSIEFTTPQTTRAVRLSLHRQNCAGSPCPAFGQLWLDGFSMTKL